MSVHGSKACFFIALATLPRPDEPQLMCPSPTEGRLGGVKSWQVGVSCWECLWLCEDTVFSSFGSMSRSVLAGCWGQRVLTSVRQHPTVLQSGRSPRTPPAVCGAPWLPALASMGRGLRCALQPFSYLCRPWRALESSSQTFLGSQVLEI